MTKQETTATILSAIQSSTDTLYSFEIIFPRFILGQVNTHRTATRNSASSRAIPFQKMYDAVMADPFIPNVFLKDHKGMQGYEILDPTEKHLFTSLGNKLLTWPEAWEEAINVIGSIALEFNQTGLSKQYCNRFLEVGAWHKVIFSITKNHLNHLLSLRIKKDAQLEFQELAVAMQKNVNSYKVNSEIKFNLPYMTNEDIKKVVKEGTTKHKEFIKSLSNYSGLPENKLICMLVSSARCARVSYTTFDKEVSTRTVDKDLDLAIRLFKSKHSSPFEHVAYIDEAGNPDDSRNFGRDSKFVQFRALIENFQKQN